MGNLRSFTFRLLVVEDEPMIIKIFEDALAGEYRSERHTFKLVSTARDARLASEAQHFHFVSIDQNIPDKAGELVSPDNGLDFCEKLVLRRVMAQRVIYTAYGRPVYANRVGGLRGTPYWEKGAQTKDAENIYTAYDWARKIRALLEENHLRFCLEQCATYLPLSMAERATQALNALNGKNEEVCLRYVLELWDNAVHLAFVQSMVLCRAAGVRPGLSPAKWRGTMQHHLDTAWRQLAEKGWLAPWEPYIGPRGLDLLDGALKHLLAVRNEDAHGYAAAKDWQAKLRAARDPIFFLMDALAYWTEHPFVIRSHFHPSVPNQVMATILSGDKSTFSEVERVADVTTPLAGVDDHVLLPWRDAEGRSLLISCFPFMVLEPIPFSNRRDMLLLSHGAPGEWYYRSLLTGKLHKKFLSDEDAQKILAVIDL